jgi:hypothetical protein
MPALKGSFPAPFRIHFSSLSKLAAITGAVLNGALCGGMLCLFVWSIHPDAANDWNARDALSWIALLFAPLALMLWVIVAGPRWRSEGLRWTRRVVQWHAVLALFLAPFGALFGVGPLSVFIAGLAVVLLNSTLLILGPKASSNSDVLEVFRYTALGFAGGSLVGLFGWSFAIMGLMVRQAEAIADGRPYCLQVGTDRMGIYKPVTSLFDLRGLKLRAPGVLRIPNNPSWGVIRNYHAVLAVEADNGVVDWWNWSHRRGQFTVMSTAGAGYPYPSQAACVADTHFARRLPILPPS